MTMRRGRDRTADHRAAGLLCPAGTSPRLRAHTLSSRRRVATPTRQAVPDLPPQFRACARPGGVEGGSTCSFQRSARWVEVHLDPFEQAYTPLVWRVSGGARRRLPDLRQAPSGPDGTRTRALPADNRALWPAELRNLAVRRRLPDRAPHAWGLSHRGRGARVDDAQDSHPVCHWARSHPGCRSVPSGPGDVGRSHRSLGSSFPVRAAYPRTTGSDPPLLPRRASATTVKRFEIPRGRGDAVPPLGLEPRTRRLKVGCSTS